LISIGILAWNEERTIADTIASVANQTLFNDGREPAELICVANGCTDDTAEVARRALTDWFAHCDPSRVITRVEEVPERGKENAWNQFVHHLSTPDARQLILMDGDVRCGSPETFQRLVEGLDSDRGAHVAGAASTKKRQKGSPVPLAGQLSQAASRLRRGNRGHFAGGMYCIRADIARRFGLPGVLLGEDAFLRAMVTTDLFTHPTDPRRVVGPSGASFEFEPYLTPHGVTRNLRRRLIGLTINAILYSAFWTHCDPQRDAGVVMAEWDSSDPQWSQRLVRDAIRARGRWVIPWGIITRHLRMLRGHSPPERIVMAPVAALATLLNMYVAIGANHALRTGHARELWTDT